MSDKYSSGGGYQYELLKANNWMLWKHRMLAVFRDLGLDKYIAKDAKAPESADPTKPTPEELKAKMELLLGRTVYLEDCTYWRQR